jgi:dihydrofolate synthase/folylpolyglutamate synthase
MTYQQTIEFLYSQLPAFHRIGKAAYKSNLQNALTLDNYLGNPHKKYPTIHVTGTNGKGSVSHMIASVLQEAGYKTGLYTSPHLKDFRERIKINGQMISKRDVTGFVKKHHGIIYSLSSSFFEMTVAMAFDYFARNEVDVAVIEVGLGGRLDSTNIIMPLLSVITNIGHDHMDLLGNTIEKVAAEKAGIIKNGIPVVIGETGQETNGIFLNKALKTGSEISFADQNFTCILEDYDPQAGERKYQVTDKQSFRKYTGETTLGGDYQSKNLVTLFQVLKILQNTFTFSEDNIIKSIYGVVANTGLKGRWQILGHNPLVVCDTGHNLEGLRYVLHQVEKIRKSSLHMVIGFVDDKDLNAILPLFPHDAVYYFTKALVPRALDEKILKLAASKYSLEGNCYPEVRSAFKAARSLASETDMIFIGGSTFIVAEVV